MERVGDDLAGFSVEYDPPSGTVLVTAWGFWSVDVASTFAFTVANACRRQPPVASLIIDTPDLKPMRDEGQRAFSHLLLSLSGLKVGRIAISTTSHLTKLQLLRLVAESGAPNVEWTNRLMPEGRNA